MRMSDHFLHIDVLVFRKVAHLEFYLIIKHIYFNQINVMMFIKFRVNEKVSTPTSVILMAFTSCCGK